MTKFNENELTKVLEGYENNVRIKLEFERAIDGKIELDDANVNYKKDIGFIEINGTNCNFRINTAMVCGYEKEDNEVKFDLENILVKLVW